MFVVVFVQRLSTLARELQVLVMQSGALVKSKEMDIRADRANQDWVCSISGHDDKQN